MSSTFSKMAQRVTDKIDQMSEKNKQSDHSSSTNYGPHSSNAANKVDPRVDSDRDGRNDPSSRVGGYGHTQGHDGYSTTTGPGGVASSDTYSSNTNNPAYNNPQSTNAGPHNSNLLNKVDPRVDSDRDGRNDPASRVGGYGATQHTHDGYNTAGGPGGFGSSNTGYGGSHTGTHNVGTHTGTHNTGMHTGTHNTSSGFGTAANTSSYDNPQSVNAGPHNSNMMNKLDPRIDSDRDGRNNPTSHTGGYGHTETGYGSGVSGNTGLGHTQSGYGSGLGGGTGVGHHNTSSGYGNSNTNTASYDGTQSTNVGPHNSNLLNKLDPRVDSDMDGRNNPASHTGGYGQTQGSYGSGVGHTGSAPAHHAVTGHGHMNTTTASYDNPQSTNAGPHKSNLLNKLDPRVGSDRDGRNDPTSHTGGYGQTQTGYGSNTGTGYNSASGPGYSTTTTTTHHPTVVTQTTHGGHHAGQHGGNQGYTGTNTGYDHPQSTNTGPHKSNLMNKLDPRVDSDRDGRDDPSSRVGGYGNTQSGGPKYY